ncbi:thermonuclease family protein [Brevundimonas sp.]|uniref:thermonuclease family protein n=1 Tax=Brevundimonas sp. TaxID=1871086 RepID=UPI0039C8976B
MDAPEGSQTCDVSGSPVRCGQRAALVLSDLLGHRPVVCEPLDTDRYGRTVARCLSGGRDIAQFMVAEGWATAYRRYSMDYVGAEAEARAARRGVWAGEFVQPEDYRRERRGGS